MDLWEELSGKLDALGLQMAQLSAHLQEQGALSRDAGGLSEATEASGSGSSSLPLSRACSAQSSASSTTWGKHGGRPEKVKQALSPEKITKPKQFLAKSMNPQRREELIAAQHEFVVFVSKVLSDRGIAEEDVSEDFFKELRDAHFQSRRTRDLRRLWQRRSSIRKLWSEAQVSVRGALRKQGQRRRLPFHKPLKRAPGAGRKSCLRPIYAKVQESFTRCRSAGNYVDKNDLLKEFDHHCNEFLRGIEAKVTRGEAVSGFEHKTRRAIEQRQRAHRKSLANAEYTKEHMVRLFGARLLKPQRLSSLSLGEEQKRCHESWHMFDCALQLACFSSLPELGEHVLQPEQFRDDLDERSDPPLHQDRIR